MNDLVRGVYEAARTQDYREEIFQREVADFFGVRQAFAVSSGKAALTLILLALKALSGRRKVIIPAYTCYSLPSSIVKAGLDLVPCDISRDSFDYDYERLTPLLDTGVLCVLSVHLFGIPSDTGRLKELCRDRGVFVVEDAAQAMGGTCDGRLLGTIGDVGFFSLGRGKSVTCGSGGIVVTDSLEIAAALDRAAAGLSPPELRDDFGTFAALILLSIFISPALYWFPAGMPFLRLGETIFHEDFPVSVLSRFQALLLSRWSERLASLNRVRREHASFYLSHVRNVRGDRAIPYLRFPVLLEGSGVKNRLLVGQNGMALGMSGMYPATVAAIPELRGRLPETRFPEAERVAASLVTLPTHPLLSEADRDAVCALVNQAIADSHPQPIARVAS